LAEELDTAEQAGENHPDPSEFAPDFGDDEQDILFRSQMKVYDLFMTNWKNLLIGAMIILAGVMVYGLMENSHRDSQREVHSELASIARSMPTPDPRSKFGLVPADDPKDGTRMGKLREAALSLAEVAKGSKGTAAVYAWMESADAWDRANEPSQQLSALEQAQAEAQGGLMEWSAVSQLAIYHSNQGDHAKSVGLLRDFADKNKNYLGEQSLFQLALVHEESGSIEESQKTLADIQTLYPESALLVRVAEMQQRLGG
jgi:hypothetical protein